MFFGNLTVIGSTANIVALEKLLYPRDIKIQIFL
jgi:Na+/H+ antiporter NhaD/arsenite permease-like protein